MHANEENGRLSFLFTEAGLKLFPFYQDFAVALWDSVSRQYWPQLDM